MPRNTERHAEAYKEWKGMPEFIQEKQKPYQQLIVRFNSQEDVEEFALRIGQKITPKTKSLWFPALVRGLTTGNRYVDENEPS